VAIVGFPNAGKSTLISVISAARPKIAAYPFTTLTPHLGVVTANDQQTLVVADIPGLIEGAHRGAGLGIRFLKHVERCRLLCHLVDASSVGDAQRDITVLERELEAFSPEVAARPRVLVASKCDAISDPARLESIRQAASRRGLPFFEISAVTRAGLKELVDYLFQTVQKSPAPGKVSDAGT
jgi:GTP-binding protein